MNTKKITALALAALMAAGTTSTAFAGQTDAGDKKPALVFGSTGVYESDDGVLVAGDGEYAPGDTLYFQLDENTNATAKYDDNDRKRVNVYADWKVGGDNVESIDILYKKGEVSSTTTGYVYTVKSSNSALNGQEVTIQSKNDAVNDVKNAIKANAGLMAKALAAGYTKLDAGYVDSNKYYKNDADGLAALLTAKGWVKKSASDQVATKTDDDNNGIGSVTAGSTINLTDTIWLSSDGQTFIDVATIDSIEKLLAVTGDRENKDPKVLFATTEAVGDDAYVEGSAPANDDAVVNKQAAETAIVGTVTGADLKEELTKPVTGYTYWVEVKTKKSDSTKELDVAGTLYLGTSKNKAEDAQTGSDKAVDFTLSNRNKDHYNPEIDDEATINADENGAVKFSDDAEEVTLYFGENEDAWFTFNAKGQGALNFGYTLKFNKEIADLFPKANIDFISWNAEPATNRTGDLYITADEDTFLYEVTENGIKEVKGAKYDEDEGAWHIRTRKLTSYAVSDIELDTTVKVEGKDEASSNSSTSSKPNGDKHNPDTGR